MGIMHYIDVAQKVSVARSEPPLLRHWGDDGTLARHLLDLFPACSPNTPGGAPRCSVAAGRAIAIAIACACSLGAAPARPAHNSRGTFSQPSRRNYAQYSVPLFVGVTLGMVVANVAEEFYNDLFFTSWGFDLGGHEVDFAFIINDILMAIHFVSTFITTFQPNNAHVSSFVRHTARGLLDLCAGGPLRFFPRAQGLALQEIAVACLPGGAMSPISKAANPIIATLGGLFGPIGFFFVMSSILYANDSYGEMPPEHRPINGGTCGAIPAPPEPHRRLGGTDDAVINITDPNPEKYSYEIISMGWGIVTATDIPLA